MDGPDAISNLCSDYPEFLSGTNKETVNSPNLLLTEKAVTRPAEGRTGIIANQR